MAYKAMAMAVCDPPSADRNAAVQRNLQKATNSQAPVALYIMGLCVLRGVGGCTRNPVAARGWFLAAADKHHRTALYQLGTLAEV
jgi:TPR repeat protein